jgi:hypothetical protein
MAEEKKAPAKAKELADVTERATKRIEAAEAALREARELGEKEKDEFMKAERAKSNEAQPELPDK